MTSSGVNKAEKVYSDFGPKERHEKNVIVPELAGPKEGFRARIRDATRMDSLLMDERITADEYCTLERFTADLYRAGLMGVKTQDYQPRVTGGFGQNVSQDAALKKIEVGDIINHLDKTCGRPIRVALIALCLDEFEWPKKHDPHLKKGIELLFGWYEG